MQVFYCQPGIPPVRPPKARRRSPERTLGPGVKVRRGGRAIALMGAVVVACAAALSIGIPTARAVDKVDEPAEAGTEEQLSVLLKKYPSLAAAHEKFKAHDQAALKEALRAAVAGEAALPPAEVLLALFYFDAGAAAQGVISLDEAAHRHPQDPESFLRLGNLAIYQGRFTDATLLLEQAEKLTSAWPAEHPRSKSAKIRIDESMATVAIRFQQWAEGRNYLEKVLALSPDNAAAHFRLGSVLFQLDDRTKGYAEFQLAYRLNQHLPTPPLAVAMYCLRTDQPKLAEQWLGFAEQKFGGDPSTRIWLADWRWRQGNVADAKRNAAAALEKDPHSASALLILGIVAHYEQDLKTAEDRLEAAFKLAPDDRDVRNHLAMVLIADGSEAKRGRALQLAEETAGKFPGNIEAIAVLGWAQFSVGRADDAMRTIQPILRANFEQDVAYFVARMVSERKGQAEARKLLEQLLKSKVPFVHRHDAEQLLDKLKP